VKGCSWTRLTKPQSEGSVRAHPVSEVIGPTSSRFSGPSGHCIKVQQIRTISEAGQCRCLIVRDIFAFPPRVEPKIAPLAAVIIVPNTYTTSNTAQILTSLVEATTDSGSNPGPDSLSLLEEALGLFQRCLAVQEYHYTESQAQAAAIPEDASMDDVDVPDTEDGGASLASDEPQDDRWATIVEPVTNSTLLDTVLAQLETLILLCNLTPASSEPTLLTFITEYSSNLLSEHPLTLFFLLLHATSTQTDLPANRLRH
jgi:hypothetical protein